MRDFNPKLIDLYIQPYRCLFYVLQTITQTKWIHFDIWISIHICFTVKRHISKVYFLFICICHKTNTDICQQKTIVSFHFLHFCLSKWLPIIQKRNHAKWTLIIVLHFIVRNVFRLSRRCKNCLYLSFSKNSNSFIMTNEELVHSHFIKAVCLAFVITNIVCVCVCVIRLCVGRFLALFSHRPFYTMFIPLCTRN